MGYFLPLFPDFVNQDLRKQT